MSFLTAKKNDMCYCPGCSHGVLLERLGEALDRLGKKPEQVCIVSDIGCIGTADRYFACHTFHGLHGRAITYAEGIKRARPDLTVVVLIGDGGCGIGTGHLVHAARRGIGITVLVANNFNFGMTGGQHSPTSPLGALTSTTPTGASDRPFDICATAVVAGAGYVARCSALDRVAGDQIAAALQSPGFSLVDLWELCVAYYVPANKLTPPRLADLSEQLNMPFGVLHLPAATPLGAEQRPALQAEAHASSHREPPGREVPSAARLDWPARAEICVAGSAGQRIRSAAGAIGEIAVAAGLFAAQQDDFPITVRKGHSISNLIIGRDPIRYTGVDEPGLTVVLSPDGLNRLGGLSGLSRGAVLVADESLTLGPTPATVHPISVARLAHEVGRDSAALPALTYGLLACGWITGDHLLQAAEAAFTGKYRESNLRAVAAGLRLARQAEPDAATNGGIARGVPS